MALLPLDDALAHVLARVSELPSVVVPIAEAGGAVLADDVVAADDVPPFDNSALDGFAVRAADVETATSDAPVRLPVVDTVLAGMVPQAEVTPGVAVRIMTGAPMPRGADAVVMVENTAPATGESTTRAVSEQTDEAAAPVPSRPAWTGGVKPRVEETGVRDGAGRTSGPDLVDVFAPAAPGFGYRTRGSDLKAGAVAVPERTHVRAAHIGVFANTGVAEVAVVRRPVVGVLSTGDELVEAGVPLGPGQIRDSNRPGLLALLREDGFEPVDLGCAPDDHDAIRAAIIDGVDRCDALVTSGGVSMGDVDLVRVVLDEIGDMRWMKLAIKPAKPFAFGTVARVDGSVTVPVFGVPGNPVSSIVSYELLARPALRKMAGFEDLHRPRVVAVAEVDLVRKPDGKVHFSRVICRYGDDGNFSVRPSGGQDSHQLAAMAAADGLAVLPDGDGVRAGDGVEVLLLR